MQCQSRKQSSSLHKSSSYLLTLHTPGTSAMANNNGAAALLMIASLLVAVTLGDARVTQLGDFVVEDAAAVPALSCSNVHGVHAGETCFSVAQSSGLTQEQFLAFNPNINCARVFVGQWVCLAASSA
ncbi:hypothetical protein PR202_ga09437 [Eleusine coracana subsp. coracana]|uniref:LysM domain-containing protein n=1 Tax=Eleusine coracana subsp. coracana TaxID=191504 RepID=A0AAV5C4A0_ELECO|nr:hypothetical protein QOZ80_1AG0035880 [Eleusine coracana subsp. coracana]GJM92929.1 hypothetical protein PR202_ga09437 [Eleusine coracana subsp. coracana]